MGKKGTIKPIKPEKEEPRFEGYGSRRFFYYEINLGKLKLTGLCYTPKDSVRIAKEVLILLKKTFTKKEWNQLRSK